MDLDSIIGRQRISPRRKPKPILERGAGTRMRGAERFSGLRRFLHTGRARHRSPGAPAEKPSHKAETAARSPAPRYRRAAFYGLAGLSVLLILGVLDHVPVRPRLPARVVLHEDASAQDILTFFVSPELQDTTAGEGGIDMPPLPVTLAVATYIVQPGDALMSIAARHRITLDTLLSMNGITDARRINAGARLRVPNISGIVHTVSRGDSVGSLASRYNVSSLAILDANDLGTSTIRPGQALFIPGARMSPTELKKALGELVIWPLRGPISSHFGYRPNPFTGIRQFHNGIDIVAPEGVAAKAAMDGRVADTGYNAIYGNYVILTHADSYQTLYGHLSRIMVKRGSTIQQGGTLGAVGTTGYSTGPHLHFSVFRRGSAMDPMKLLK